MTLAVAPLANMVNVELKIRASSVFVKMGGRVRDAMLMWMSVKPHPVLLGWFASTPLALSSVGPVLRGILAMDLFVKVSTTLLFSLLETSIHILKTHNFLNDLEVKEFEQNTLK